MKEMSNNTRIIFTEAGDNDLFDKCVILISGGERGYHRFLILNLIGQYERCKFRDGLHISIYVNVMYISYILIYYNTRSNSYLSLAIVLFPVFTVPSKYPYFVSSLFKSKSVFFVAN